MACNRYYQHTVTDNPYVNELILKQYLKDDLFSPSTDWSLRLQIIQNCIHFYPIYIHFFCLGANIDQKLSKTLDNDPNTIKLSSKSKTQTLYILFDVSTLHFKETNLAIYSTRDFQNGLDTINSNWFYQTKHVCPNTSFLGAIITDPVSLKWSNQKMEITFPYQFFLAKTCCLSLACSKIYFFSNHP